MQAGVETQKRRRADPGCAKRQHDAQTQRRFDGHRGEKDRRTRVEMSGLIHVAVPHRTEAPGQTAKRTTQGVRASRAR